MKHVAVGILTQNGRVLACQRKRDARYALKWEFPGGKMEEGETPRNTVVRELREELAINAHVVEELFHQDWLYSEGSSDSTGDSAFRVFYFMIREFSGIPKNHAFEQIRWVEPGELQGMDILEGNRKAVEFLAANAKKNIQQHIT